MSEQKTGYVPDGYMPTAGSAEEEVEVVAWRYRHSEQEKWQAGVERKSLWETEPLMTVAQHNRIVAALSAQQSAQDDEYPPCDYCGVVPDCHPWHGSGAFRGVENPHIHACNDCRHLLPTAQSAPERVSVPRERIQIALEAVQNAMEDAYNNAYQECCGRCQGECCGDPIAAWSDADHAIMDALAPAQRELSALLNGGEA